MYLTYVQLIICLFTVRLFLLLSSSYVHLHLCNVSFVESKFLWISFSLSSYGLSLYCTWTTSVVVCLVSLFSLVPLRFIIFLHPVHMSLCPFGVELNSPQSPVSFVRSILSSLGNVENADKDSVCADIDYKKLYCSWIPWKWQQLLLIYGEYPDTWQHFPTAFQTNAAPEVLTEYLH